MRYLLVAESVEDLLSLPNDPPLLAAAPPPNSLTLEGGGSELAELSLSVEAESRSPPLRDLWFGFLSEELDPPLSDSLPYSPNFLGGTSDLAGDALLLLAFELSESPPSDFLRSGGVSPSASLLLAPRRRGRPQRCEEGRGGRGSELGAGQRLPPSEPGLRSAVSCMRCCWEARPCFSSRSMAPGSYIATPPPAPLPVTPANSGLGIFPFLCAATGLVNPGKQQRPR
jgi:hypothetical protein